ncbi:hypothetical protein CsSME_00018528 [Camellia sinensis var. sinensis]
MEDEKYSKELDVAVRVVHLACFLCQRVQEGLVSTNSDHVKSKDDDSPVTVAGAKLISMCKQWLAGCCQNTLVDKMCPLLPKKMLKLSPKLIQLICWTQW